GGRATLIGPIIGAILVNGGKTIFTGLFPEFWLFALGGLFVAVTLFLPKGVVGTIGQYLGKRKKVPNSAPAAAQEDGIEPKIQAAE
ncbi:urea ABC transporter permease subunit UrtC, partial [Rhizobium leguminosarum bv. viciae]|nr:urea ABC transporter permease subunit UrtC [Rhizobium leguminosarum bv. viciae]